MNLKTKKILLLISTFLAFIVDISYAIGIYAGIIELESFGDIIEISYNFQLTILSLCALVNFISLFFIFRNVLAHKKKLIFLNIIQFAIGNIINIISGIINIIILTRKTKDIEEEVKEKKELPVLEDITKYKWYVYFIIFAFLFIICYTPLIDILPIPNTKMSAIISIGLLYVIQIILLVIPMLNELKRDFRAFKNNFKLYLSNILPRFGLIVLIYLFCNLSVMSFVASIPTNQALLNELPLYLTAILSIFIAPLIEELMFRGFMKKFIKNDILFIVLSSLLFGGLHVAVASSLHQLWFIIPYSILGLAFSLNYVKTKNIVSNIFLHSAWNSIAVVAMALMKFMI